MSSLQSFARQESASPSLCATHIRLLSSPSNPIPPSPVKVLKLARKYSSEIPDSVEVWLARLTAEKQYASRKEVEQAWADARDSVQGTSEDLERVWMWGLEQYVDDDEVEDMRRIHEVHYKTIPYFADSTFGRS